MTSIYSPNTAGLPGTSVYNEHTQPNPNALTPEKLLFVGAKKLPKLLSYGDNGEHTLGILRANFDTLIKDTGSSFELNNYSEQLGLSYIRPGLCNTFMCTTWTDNQHILRVVLFNSHRHLNNTLKAIENLTRYPQYLIDDRQEHAKILTKELLLAGYLQEYIITEIFYTPIRIVLKIISLFRD